MDEKYTRVGLGAALSVVAIATVHDLRGTHTVCFDRDPARCEIRAPGRLQHDGTMGRLNEHIRTTAVSSASTSADILEGVASSDTWDVKVTRAKKSS